MNAREARMLALCSNNENNVYQTIKTSIKEAASKGLYKIELKDIPRELAEALTYRLREEGYITGTAAFYDIPGVNSCTIQVFWYNAPLSEPTPSLLTISGTDLVLGPGTLK